MQTTWNPEREEPDDAAVGDTHVGVTYKGVTVFLRVGGGPELCHGRSKLDAGQLRHQWCPSLIDCIWFVLVCWFVHSRVPGLHPQPLWYAPRRHRGIFIGGGGAHVVQVEHSSGSHITSLMQT